MEGFTYWNDVKDAHGGGLELREVLQRLRLGKNPRRESDREIRDLTRGYTREDKTCDI